MSDLEPIVIDINSSDTKTGVSLNNDNQSSISDRPSVNFGGGIELLMNEKKRGSSADIGLGELSDLENELNDLSTDIDKKTLENSRSSLFDNAINNISQKVSFKDNDETSREKVKNVGVLPDTNKLGEQTSQNFTQNKTWDGYGKFNNIPVETNEQSLTKEELVREKFKFLRRLEEL